MKQISTNLLAVLCVMLLLFTACKKNSDFTVEGVVSGADGQMMYLENVGVSTVELMDSVKLTAAGKFSFTKPRPAFPDFYRLRLNNQLINFSVDSTETISFVADAGLSLLLIAWRAQRIARRSRNYLGSIRCEPSDPSFTERI